ncbi:hydrogenase accessory protein HypB [Hydrogenobacter thermophilus TK-6]|uniref:Hydrogenase accessory protein n=2 Tax=Hydrogenobacter thermophilus TaxID=940 RepID=D3DI09_HYDTT|nr:hydrogenase nickel incorporation protein HypB [Hydrogenobacter thermophilus]ADO45394.1 hydrogenase accessory protein HypB [Hydrogenobacter thermophilus TK-6]BAF73685.1 hydrogenase accessory protein [Hydrogenobacter thermophilus TK-6]BAI69461.1 hydrogenase accessory protein [Hydrogenobacter thermophilus TK-6]
MCRECGCSVNHTHEKPAEDKKTLEVFTKILDANDRQAQENREHFDEHGIYCINLMSSPGAGKTSLLEKTIELLRNELRIGVIEGDLETSRDAERIKSKGAPAYQITTGSACHLDAFMVHEGIHHLPLEDLDVVFVENVGNLVCPASYDVGAHLNVVLLSVTEGDDKPEKYPVMFKSADLMLITKTDLLPYVDFSVERAVSCARKIKPSMDFIALSVKTGEGLENWMDYLRFKIKVYKGVVR